MATAATKFGTPCSLYIDADNGQVIQPGDFVKTNGGSVYEVQSARKVEGKYPNRWSMKCMRYDPMMVPADATVIMLHWYERKPRRT